ncbi:hypothetical protein [Lysinibacillus xylanilyticus]|nr:hypothetical protein [Lysinibacillus xylanilyticus]
MDKSVEDDMAVHYYDLTESERAKFEYITRTHKRWNSLPLADNLKDELH